MDLIFARRGRGIDDGVRKVVFADDFQSLLEKYFDGLQLNEGLPYNHRHQVRGGAVWQLVGLITRRSQVQILPPLPIPLPFFRGQKKSPFSKGFSFVGILGSKRCQARGAKDTQVVG